LELEEIVSVETLLPKVKSQ